MAGKSTLRDGAIRILSSIGIYLIWAIVLVIGLALSAGQIGSNLCSNTGTVTNCNSCNLGPDLDDLANHFVSNAKRKWDVIAPSTADGVNIGSADTTGVNSNIDIIFLEFLKR